MNTGNVLQKIWALPLVMLLAAFMSVGSATAQNTYYVDVATGNDTFDGSQMSVGAFPAGPFATINQAMTTAVSGDTIVILAGNYVAQGLVNPANENFTMQVRTSGGNLNVLVEGFTADDAGRTLTLGVETGGSGGAFVTDGDADDLTLTTGTVDVTGSLTIGNGGTITRSNGSLTGTAPTTSTLNVTYTGVLTSGIASGNEFPASLSGGTATFTHTGALVTVGGNKTAGNILGNSAGSFTFSGNVTTTSVGANSIQLGAAAIGGAATFSGSVTVAGGIDTNALTTKTLSMGAVSMGNSGFNNLGTGAITVASLDLNAQNLDNDGTMTVTGQLTLGNAAPAVRADNDGNLTLGSVVAEITDTAGNDADLAGSYTLDNAAGDLIINGGITEYHVLDAGGAGAADILDATVALVNANGGEIHIGASSTIGGQIANAEADAGVDGDGIVLNNNAVLTVNDQVGNGNITQYGDIVGGTLVIDYANGGVDATIGVPAITLANNVTFTANASAVVLAGALTAGGNVRIQDATTAWATTFTVTGTLFLEANAHTNTGAGPHSFGGIDIGSTNGHSFAGNVTITGATANLGNTTFAGTFTANAATVASSAGATFTGTFSAGGHTVSGAGTVTMASTVNTTGNVTVASGTTYQMNALGATSDIGGNFDINGTANTVGAVTLGVGSMDVDPATGTFQTAGATNLNFDGAGFTGGTYTDTGSDDTVTFNVPSAGTTVSVLPGTVWGNLVFNGSGRTATVTESVTVAGNVNLGNDVTVALGDNSIVMSGAGGVLTLNDEAAITNSGSNGSVQFAANAQRITVAGAPNVTPSLSNIVVNNVGGANPLWVDENINIAGTLALLDGGILVDGDLPVAGPYTGAAGANPALAATVTFTGGSAAIARTFPNEGITLGAAPNDVVAGTYNLIGSGTTGAFGAEYAASQIRDLTVSATGAVTTAAATAATISGNVNISNATGSFTTSANATVAGNVTVTGTLGVGAGTTFGFSGVLTTANNATGGIVNGAGTLRFNGASQSHVHAGDIQAPSRYSATGIVVNGSTAAGDANGDSEMFNILIDAGADVTMNNIQDVNGTVTVNGTGTINLVNDGGPAIAPVDADGQITGLVDVNNGGALTVSSNDALTTLTAGATVNDGGTFTLGSNLGAAAAMAIGDGSQATAATFDLNGNTFTANGAAASVVPTASTAATAPGFGTSGTLAFPAGGGIFGATNPTIPNMTFVGDGAAATTEIDSDVTVTGTFTVGVAGINGANGDDVTLSGANATGAFNGNYSATIGAAGSQIITTGTNITTNLAAVAIANLTVNSTSATTLSRSNAGAATFTVNYLNHDAGVLDITDETFVMAGDGNPATIDWDYDGGSYAGTGTYSILEAAPGNEVDMDLNNASVSIPNLTVGDTAPGGLQLGTTDNLTVTGTLTLNGGAGNVQTENGANDATFAVGNSATIVRSTGGATNHFDNAPTLGTGLTVRYTSNTAGVVTSAELPSTLARLEWEGTAGASTFQLADNRAITVDYLEMASNVSVDDDDDGNNSITITNGGTVDYDGDNAVFNDNTAPTVATTETFTPAGSVTLLFNSATFTTDDRHWPDVLTGSNVTVQINGANAGGGNDTVTLHENKNAGTVTVGDGTVSATNGTATLATAATTLTAGTLNVVADGIVTGTVVVSGNLTSTGTTAGVAITAQGNVTLAGAAPGALTLNGTTAQTLAIPAAGFVLGAPLTINNAAGVTQTGGPLTTALAGPGLVLTTGVFNVANLTIGHGGPGAQGFTQTNGCVFGNVTKAVVGVGGGPGSASADRLQYPLCTQSGTQRTAAITFNDPGAILSAPANITIRHDQAGENGVVDLTGINQLNTTVNGVNISRYPTGPSFFWTITPNFTMSPSLSYDVELRGTNYPNFSTSCNTAACDINEIFAIRRAVGSPSNPWVVASSTIDNFLSGTDSPVVITRSGTGSLQTSGTVWTYGLKSIFAASGTAPSIAVTEGFGHALDLSTLFTGFTGNLTYTAVSSDDTDVSSPTTTNITGNNLTVVGGSKVGSATVTVNATDSFGSTASATFTVTNGAALTATSDNLDRTLNVGDTSTVTFASAFSGGAGTVTYTAASSDASVTVASDGTTATLTAASNGAATITLTGVDASTTAVTVTKTFTVTVNNAVSVANAVADQTVVQGATATVDVSNVFANGTGAVTVAVSGGNTTAGATIVGNTVTITGLAAYSGTPLADTAPVTVTLTGTDTIGGTATDAFDVTVNPVAGAVSGGGAVSAFDASLILNEFLGKSSPALTAKQLVAADFDGDNDIDPFDAYQVYVAAGGAPKADIRDAFASADVAFGEMTQNGTIISLPIVIMGDVAEAAAISFQTTIDPAIAQVAEVVNNSDWMMVTDVAEDGTVRLAAIGGESLPADGVVATINISVPETFAAFMLNGQGAVNNNTISEIDAVEVIEIPGTFALEGNYPNPFNPTTTIQFDLPESADVEVQIFDMIGRQVMSIPSQTIAAGAKRSLQLNASQLASGSYFYRVVAKMKDSVAIDTGRMTLVK